MSVVSLWASSSQRGRCVCASPCMRACVCVFLPTLSLPKDILCVRVTGEGTGGQQEGEGEGGEAGSRGEAAEKRERGPPQAHRSTSG